MSPEHPRVPADGPAVVIAIDGPAASGKSSVARALARRLGLGYVNSGALYRGATWHVLAAGLNPEADPTGVAASLARADIRCAFPTTTMTGETGGGLPTEAAISFDGDTPTAEALRAAEINANVSLVSKVPEARERLTTLLRALMDEPPPGGGLVMEGRDIGSAVFPRTPFKFYIDASQEVRAQRRSLQGGGVDDLARRDYTDSHRRTAPLTIAEDAHVIDSSRLTIDGVVGEVIGRLKMKGFTLLAGEL